MKKRNVYFYLVVLLVFIFSVVFLVNGNIKDDYINENAENDHVDSDEYRLIKFQDLISKEIVAQNNSIADARVLIGFKRDERDKFDLVSVFLKVDANNQNISGNEIRAFILKRLKEQYGVDYLSDNQISIITSSGKRI